MIRRLLRRARRAPLIVAALLSTPLFFAALMAASLAVERPVGVKFLYHGRQVLKYLPPTTSNEAEIWGLTFAVIGMLLLVGLVAMFVPRGVYLVSVAAIILALAVTHRLDLWKAHHGERFPLGIDLIKEANPSNTLNKGEWESRAAATASQLRWVTIAGAGAAILIGVLFELRRRRAAEGHPVFAPPAGTAPGVVQRSTLRRWF